MKRIAAVVLSLALLVPALAAAEEASELYSQKCAACHGKDGKGTPVGKKMGAQDLTATKASEAEMAGVISNGKGKMTAYKGKLSDEQITSIARWIKAGMK